MNAAAKYGSGAYRLNMEMVLEVERESRMWMQGGVMEHKCRERRTEAERGGERRREEERRGEKRREEERREEKRKKEEKKIKKI